jgi:hypothetical protein
MACNLTLGRLEPCKDSVGGLKNIYFVNYNNSAIAVTYDSTDTDVIDELGTDVPAYKYELKATANTFTQTVNSSRDNGTTFWEQVLSVTLKKLDKKSHKELKLLAYGRPHVIIEDNNGNLFYAGLDHGMDVTGGDITTGGAMGDTSGYTLTLTGQEKIPANFLIPASGTTVAEKLSALGVDVVVGT